MFREYCSLEDLCIQPTPTSRLQNLWGTWETLLGATPSLSYRSYLRREKRAIIPAGSDHSPLANRSHVRLLGYWNDADGQARGTVLLLHGWEGSSHGIDILSIGAHLNQLGYHTMRVNFRDHGNTHIYNEGIFNGSLIEEMSQTAAHVGHLHPRLPLIVVGCSLGGNFALRIGYRDNPVRVPNLENVVVLCPALDPFAASVAIDSHPLFRQYFCRAWKRSLRYKSNLYPESFCAKKIQSIMSVVGITEALVVDHFGFDDLSSYYDTYTITPYRLRSPRCRVNIVTSRNDPIILSHQFIGFQNLSDITLKMTDYGGHIGYMSLNPFRRGLPLIVEAALNNSLSQIP